jgi:hypothetical protein
MVLRRVHQKVDQVFQGAEGVRIFDVVARYAEVVVGFTLFLDGA